MSSDDVTVLVVEDERELADTYARWLEGDYEVRTAYTGEAALETIDGAVDVVLLDRRLPDVRGGMVLGRLREEGYDCRVAMLTAVDPDFDILEMPFDDYVVKPVLRAELAAVVDRLRSLSTYDRQVRESFSLATKLESLAAEKPETELEDSEEYRCVKSRLAELQETIDTAIQDLEEGDVQRVYKGIASGEESNVDRG